MIIDIESQISHDAVNRYINGSPADDTEDPFAIMGSVNGPIEVQKLG